MINTIIKQERGYYTSRTANGGRDATGFMNLISSSADNLIKLLENQKEMNET